MKSSATVINDFITLEITFSRDIPLTAVDKVLFCIHQNLQTPKELMDKLDLTKGNLANYCKFLIEKNYITQQKIVNKRGITYEITHGGKEYLNKIFEKINKHTKILKSK